MIRSRDFTLYLLAGLWLAAIAILAVMQPGALALSTVTTVLQFSTILALVALGQAMVIPVSYTHLTLPTSDLV